MKPFGINAFGVGRYGVPDNDWSPLELAPSVWYDLNNNTSITIEGSGCSKLKDLSGNGNDVTQETDAARPILPATGVLEFDGTDDVLQNLKLSTNTSAGIGLSTWVSDIGSGGYGILWGGLTFYWRPFAGTTLNWYHTGTTTSPDSWDTGAVSLHDATPVHLVLNWTGSETQLWINNIMVGKISPQTGTILKVASDLSIFYTTAGRMYGDFVLLAERGFTENEIAKLYKRNPA